MKERNVTFDLMKGGAIILMMIVHLVFSDKGDFAHFCYSFHMPLFFILAGIFAKEIADISSFKDFTLKNAKRLLLPFYVTMLMRIAWGGLQAYLKQDAAYIIRPTLSMLVASPDGWETQWGLVYAGPMWFLIALFWVREIFYGLQYAIKALDEKYRDMALLGISVSLSIISVILYPYVSPFPFCITQAFTALAFYALGYYIHKHPLPKWAYCVCVLIWPLAIYYGNISLAFCSISYYPLSFLGACGGTYVVYLLCKGWNKVVAAFKYPSLLAWCGVFSLAILCMHELELYTGFIWSVICRVPQVAFIVGWGEVAIAIIMAIIIVKIPYLKKIYS